MTSLMYPDPPAAALVEAARVRSSRRSFDGKPVDSANLGALEGFIHSFHPSDLARTVLLRDAPADLFTGIIGSYGKVGGASSALVFVGAGGTPGVDECVGYTGEAAVLEATRLGLGTCWIGGTFSASRTASAVGLEPGERVFGISPVGYAAASLSFAERTVFGHKTPGPKARKSDEEIAAGNAGWPAWARAGVQAARLAPSAMNRQPWRFAYENGAVIVSYDGADAYKSVSKRLDCGIAMLHFELGARHAGVAGHWELLEAGARVARFNLA